MLGLGALARKVFGSTNDRKVKAARRIVTAINELEPQFAALTDDDIRARTQTFRDRVAAGESLDSLLPMNRRARLWDLYTERYREIAKEAEDDFHALFGREFLRAYEEQVKRLHESS